MKKITPFIICLCIPFLLTSCYPNNSWLGKPVKPLVDQLLSNFNYRTVWNDSLFHIYKETESSDGGISSTIILTEEGKIRKKLTTDFIKSLRKDFINKKLTCEQKQSNLETSYNTYFETAKQRNWLYTSTVYDTEGDLKKLLNEISYPCSSYQKEVFRQQINNGQIGFCRGKNPGENVLCPDTRKLLEKYDKEYLEFIDKYGIDNIYEYTPEKGKVLRSL